MGSPLPPTEPKWVLSGDGRELISLRESKIRGILEFGYRFLVSVFLSAQLFDFLFSPVWMHGYIWALNLQLDIDLSDKSAGVILDHQLAVVGYAERLLYAILSTLSVIMILRLAGYGHKNRSVWHLLLLSLACGGASSLARCCQMKHRLYPAIHEFFYIYLNFFLTGFCMTWRCFERFPTVLKEPIVVNILESEKKNN